MPNIYKLRYENKTDGLIDLVNKIVIDINGNYINGTEAVVECEMPDYGYHCDIMTTDDIIFNSEVFPKNAKYKFAGHE